MMFSLIGLIIPVAIVWGIYSVFAKGNGASAPIFPEEMLRDVTPSSQSVETGQGSALQTIIQVMRLHGIRPEDVARAWDDVPLSSNAQATFAAVKPRKTMGEIAMQVCGYLGAVFVFSGIGVYITSFWDGMSSFGRIAITLGVGWLLHVVLIQFLRSASYLRAQVPLLVMANVMLATGWFVFIYENFPHGSNPQKAVMAVCAVMTLIQAGTYYLQRVLLRDGALVIGSLMAMFILLYFYGFLQAALDLLGMDWQYVAVLLGASLLSVASWLRQSRYSGLASVAYFFAGIWLNSGLFEIAHDATSYATASVVIGLSLMSSGYGLKSIKECVLGGWAYFFGSAMFFAGLFDWVNHTPFELLYFGAIISMIYACTVLQSRAILFTSICALLGYIGYYSSQYFVNSLGWPLALMLMGLMFFGVAMLAVKVKKRITHTV
jgi:hypothetical protein